MKNLQNIGHNHSGYNHRSQTSNHLRKLPRHEPLTGSLSGMFPVILDGGKTVIYISDKNKENDIRQKYAMRK